MAIRFPCPSCEQPIEIDDQWSGQSVGCPYCKKVVTAPSSSTWPPGDVPIATPAQSEWQPPPPPGRADTPPRQRAMTPASAKWALLCAVTCACLSVLAWFTYMSVATTALYEKLGLDPGAPPPSQQEMAEAWQDMWHKGEAPKSPYAASAAWVGIVCGLAGVVLAVRALMGGAGRKGIAIAACIVSICFLFCQSGVLLLHYASDQMVMPAPTTRPAPENDGESGTENQTTAFVTIPRQLYY